MRRLVAFTALLLVALAATAGAAPKGASTLALQLGQGSGDFLDPLQSGNYITVGRDNRTQVQLGAEYWYQLTDDYAFTVAGSYGFYSETDKPGNSPAPTDLETKYSTTGFKVRLGGDRTGEIGDRFTWFMGPGLEYWSGRNKFENLYGTTAPDNDVEGPTVTRFGINGRFGGVMELSDQFGIMGRIGHTLGYASAEEKGAKATWYPSSFEAMWGLNFTFGGQ